MRVTATILTYNRVEPLEKCIDSISPFVDSIIVGVDSRTTDKTISVLARRGISYYRFNFINFSKARNDCLSRVKTPWAFVIDDDETILASEGPAIRKLVKKYHSTKTQGIHFARRHWYDLEMQREWKHPYPDSTYRLLRSHIRYIGAAHEQPDGIIYGVGSKDLEIQHFNQYYRTTKDWKIANTLYRKLRGE